MTRKHYTNADIARVKGQLAALIEDMLLRDPLVTHENLTMEHVRVDKSTRAEEEVGRFGGLVVVALRRAKNLALVPITAAYHSLTAESTDVEVAAAVAGAGAGGARIGWYMPSGEDDPLWLTYIGMRLNAGAHAIFWSAKAAGHLVSENGMQGIAAKTAAKLPVPPEALEATYERVRNGDHA